MKIITIWKNETTETYTIAIDAVITHECVAADEIAGIVDETMKERKN